MEGRSNDSRVTALDEEGASFEKRIRPQFGGGLLGSYVCIDRKWRENLKIGLKIKILVFLQFKQQRVELCRSMSEEQISQCQEPEVAGFVAKTFQILNNQEYGKIIFWGPSGKDFIIKDINKFQQIVLPKYFRHKKINSFIRQLNMYGFHKSRKDNAKSIFSHPNFIKDREDLLATIKRKIKLIEPPLKTPTKQKSCSQEKRIPPTAAKEQDVIKRSFHEPSQGVLKGFFESRQCLNSVFNLNVSLKKVSMNELDEERMEQEGEDKVSIELGIEERDQNFEGEKIINPSFFFNSWKQPKSMIK